jgi:hypothetical protein
MCILAPMADFFDFRNRISFPTLNLLCLQLRTADLNFKNVFAFLLLHRPGQQDAGADKNFLHHLLEDTSLEETKFENGLISPIIIALRITDERNCDI